MVDGWWRNTARASTFTAPTRGIASFRSPYRARSVFSRIWYRWARRTHLGGAKIVYHVKAAVMKSAFLLIGSAFFLLAQQTPQQAAHHFKTPDGLEATLWAAEPMLENPTNIDIDERGRVWVLEGVNYRRQLKHLKDFRPNGDRILILEDTHGNGRAGKVTVFDENPVLRSPLGIAVLGNKVIVSQ